MVRPAVLPQPAGASAAPDWSFRRGGESGRWDWLRRPVAGARECEGEGRGVLRRRCQRRSRPGPRSQASPAQPPPPAARRGRTMSATDERAKEILRGFKLYPPDGGPRGRRAGERAAGGAGAGGVGGWVPPFPCVRAVVMATLPPPPPPGAVRIASSPPPRVAGSVPMDAVCSGPRWAGGGPGGGSAALRPGSCGGAPCGHCRLRGAGSFSGSAAVLRLLTLLSAVHGKSFRLVAWRAGRARVHCRCSETDSGWGGPACGLPALGKGTAQREGPCACEGGRNVRLLNLP